MMQNIINPFFDWLIYIQKSCGWAAMYLTVAGIVGSGVVLYSGVETLFRKLWRKKES